MENLENKTENEFGIDLKDRPKNTKKYLLFFIIIFLIASSFFVGYGRGKNSSGVIEKNVSIGEAVMKNGLTPDDKNIDFSLFWKVWDLLKEKHIDREKIDAQKLVYGAISGMLKATGDPYTDFFDPKQSKEFSEDIEGTFEGIGAELGIKDDILTIIAPLDDSPAQKAGLRSGDKIFKVDEKIVADMTIDQAVDVIRGKKGTQVKLTILHKGDDETKEVTVTRDKIEVKNVKIEFKEGEIAYIKLIKFSDNVDIEFNDAVDKIIAKRSKGIVLDLRNNPGGLLDKTVEVASKMIPKDKIVVIEEDHTGKKENLKTMGGDRLSSIPMVVLINEGSASASEILAGALKDNQGISLIGEKSFGKGSVQQLLGLPGGSSVKITVAKWLTPKGDYIMEKGIEPDIKIEFTKEDYENERDPQLDKALEIIKEKIK